MTIPKKNNIKATNILVVDDNEGNLIFVRFLLKQAGYQFDTASDGLEAVEAVKGGMFTMVFMDCNMPRLDGYGATQQIRAFADERINKIPIIALTANKTTAIQQQCLDVGMNDFLIKPLDMEKLKVMIEKWRSQ